MLQYYSVNFARQTAPVVLLGRVAFARSIYYVGSAWRPTVNHGTNSSAYVMAHELNHAYDHEVTGYPGENYRKYREDGSVRFTNYVRSVYGETDMRTKYSGLGLIFSDDPASYNPNNESVTDFTTEFESSVGGVTAMGFSYNKSSNGEDAKKAFQIGIVNADGKYIYAIYDNEDDYNAAVNRVKEYQKSLEEKEEEDE